MKGVPVLKRALVKPPVHHPKPTTKHRRRHKHGAVGNHHRRRHRRHAAPQPVNHSPVPDPPSPRPQHIPPPDPPPRAVETAVSPPPPPPPPQNIPVPVYANPVEVRHMERLLWRAGFGPTPAQAEKLARLDRQSAVFSLTRPAGQPNLVGPAPHDGLGNPLAPADAWGHDHCYWLDRMVRSDQSLVERMALNWHDWFATSNSGVNSQQQMLDQCQTFRDRGLGSFLDLLVAVTRDPAMLIWLNGTSNDRWNPNENYAREVMELFTLGADRGAYTEQDVREAARALTGFRNDWSSELGNHNFRYDASYHDDGVKTIFGQSGAFSWQDVCRMLVEHPLHASFFVTKLWGYFVPTPPDTATLSALQNVYISSGYGIRPVVEAILQHPDFFEGGELVKEPVAYMAGMLRALGRGIDTTDWAWLGSESGQQLFYPPNVSGWDYGHWLDTSTLRGRWHTANYASMNATVDPWPPGGAPVYDAAEDAPTAIARAMTFWGRPSLTKETQRALADFANGCLPWPLQDWQQAPYRAMRQNALRMLLVTSPDMQTS